MCEKKVTVRAVLGNKVFWYCLIVAAVVLAICTKSSFLYPLNDCVDANCYYTVGKSVLFGKVPYRDLYEHKGPLIYMIHTVGYLLSPNSFNGVYLLEVFAAAVFLFSVYLVLKDYCKWAAVVCLPILAALAYSAPSFAYGGAEEWCLPMYMVCFLVSFRAIKMDEAVSPGGWFTVGAMAACVLWIKYTMMGFFPGWFIVPAVIAVRKGGGKKLLSSIGWGAAGVLAVSVPILLYFAVNGALDDLWQVYFYDNLFSYADVEVNETQTIWEKIETILNTVWTSTKLTFKRNLQYSILTQIGLVWLLLREKWSLKIHLATVLVCTCLVVYGGGRGYIYYGFILAAFAFLGLIPVCWVLGKIRVKESVPRACALLSGVLALVIAYTVSDDVYMMSYDKDDTPQYQFAEIIHQKEDATLLNYGFLDGGFYLAAEIVPENRFFCRNNMPIPEMMEEQKAIVAGGKVDFVVTRSYPISSENYVCVAEASMFSAGSEHHYYLFQLKEAVTN